MSKSTITILEEGEFEVRINHINKKVPSIYLKIYY